MHLSDHSLRPIDDEYVRSWGADELRDLSLRLLADLQEARERLNQGPTNSSRPPSSRAPWEHGEVSNPPHEPKTPQDEAESTEAPLIEAEPAKARPAEVQPCEAKPARKAGKQPGAPGMGRTQGLKAQELIPHYPQVCAGCGRPLTAGTNAVAYTGFQALDLRWGTLADPGLRLWVVDHRYDEILCDGGHRTRAVASYGEGDPSLLAGGELSEWRLVGPGLAVLIVALALRFRLSRARIQEFLREWLGVELSIGTIPQTIPEAGAAVAPAEDERVEAVLKSQRLHADETSWPERGQGRWLGVFTAATVTLYSIAGRGKELLENVLEGFQGWLMTDGWIAYRGFPRRLRCGAPLVRQARGLTESYHREARAFGRPGLDTLKALRAAVYVAREGPPVDLRAIHADALEKLRAACEQARHPDHAKTHALAVELLNDGDAIFQVLHHPELPLTHNEAERALRHGGIMRKLSYGTRTATGSRIFALLASVIDTCRQRGHSPWLYLQTAIADRRADRSLAPLPQ